MIIKTDFFFRKLTVFSLAIFGLCLWSGSSMAQSEQEKSGMGQEKPIEKPLVENQSDHVDVHVFDNQSPAATSAKSIRVSPPKKENNLSGEGKKAEPAPSTLSFNIFLYIVDKFKAD